MKNKEPDKSTPQPASLLDKISRENPYRVPEGYFENLPGNILKRIAEEKPVRTSFLKRYHFIRYAAAAFVAIAAITATTLFFSKTNLNNTSLNDYTFTYEEVAASSDFHDLDEELISEALTLEKQNHDVTQMENYLIESNTDIELFTEN